MREEAIMGLPLVVLLGVALRHVDEAGGVVHDESIAHLRVGVVLGSAPVGQLRIGDVRTGPADIVVGFGVRLEQDGVGDGLRDMRASQCSENPVAVVIRPEAIERRVGKLVAIDDGWW